MIKKLKNIGIKLFNGDFVPVLAENEKKSKKLILTTVRNNQKKAIIELYEGTSNKCINNEYLGKLVININRNTKKGEPAIEVHLRLDENGVLYAKAWDTESNAQSEVQIEHSPLKQIVPETLSDQEITTMKKNTIATEVSAHEKEGQSSSGILRIALIVFIGIILVGLLGTGIFFGIKALSPAITGFFASLGENENKPNDNQNLIVQPTTQPTVLISEPPSPQPTEQIKQDVIGLKDNNGVKHYVRWGDNLWNICKRYYQDPWYYPDLAKMNSIRNPRKIYAGTYIIIPPKSELNPVEHR